MSNLANSFVQGKVNQINSLLRRSNRSGTYAPDNPSPNSKIASAVSRKMEMAPQFDYLWRIIMPDLKIVPIGATGWWPLWEGEVPEPQDIEHRIYGVSAPYKSFETEKNTKGSAFMYTAKHHDIGSVQLTMDEMEDGKTLHYLEYWMSLVEYVGRHNPPAFYKRDVVVVKMGSSKIDMHVSVYRGVFPANIADSNYNYDSNSVTQYQVTFSCDGVDHIYMPESDVNRIIRTNDELIRETTLANKKSSKVVEPDAVVKLTNLVLEKIL